MGVKRTTTEAELRAWIDQGWTHGQIAKELGLAKVAISMACAVLGIRKYRDALDDEKLAEIVGLIGRGHTLQSIASSLGETRQNLHQKLNRKGLPSSAAAFLRAQQAVKS